MAPMLRYIQVLQLAPTSGFMPRGVAYYERCMTVILRSSFDRDLRQNITLAQENKSTPKQTVFWLVISRITLDDGERPLVLSLFLFDKRLLSYYKTEWPKAPVGSVALCPCLPPPVHGTHSPPH